MVQTKLKKTRGKRLLSAVRKHKKLMKRSARPRALRRLSEKMSVLHLILQNVFGVGNKINK